MPLGDGEMLRLTAPVKSVRHGDLRPFGTGGYKRVCPECGGLLLGRRHDGTFRILRRDYCLTCGQRYLYTDAEINGEQFHVE